MATANLTAQVSAKGARKTKSELDGVSKSAKSAEGEVLDLSSAVDKMSSSFKSSKKALSTAKGGFDKLSKASAVLSSAVTFVAVVSANANKEVEILSRQAKLSTNDFEALAFATNQFGINAEQIGDISKDLSDKLGEFGRDATGPFQDFANSAKLSKEEAQALAIELEDLSSDKVIGILVSKLEEAGSSGNEMTQVLESMGNDLSRLTPLFANNGAELDKLTGRYKDVNSQLSITSRQADDLQGLSTTFTLLTSSIGNAGEAISANLAPEFEAFFNGVIDVVPDATNAVIDFINSFKSAEAINDIESINRLIDDQKESINSLKAEQAGAQGVIDNYFGNTDIYEEKVSSLNDEIAKETEELKLLIAQQKVLNDEQDKLDKVGKGKGGSFTSGAAGGGGAGAGTVLFSADQAKTELDAILALNQTKIEAVDSAELTRIEKANSLLAQELITAEQHQDALTEIEFNAEVSREQIRKEQSDKKKQQFEEENALAIESGQILSSSLADGLLSVAKSEAKLGDVIVSTVGKVADSVATAILQKQIQKQVSSAIEGAAFLTEKVAESEATVAQAGLNAFASTAAIPVVGPELAPAAAAAATGVAQGLATGVIAAASARRQGGNLAEGQVSTIAENNELEVIAPASASRVRTKQQMQQLMGGEIGGQANVSIVVIDQSPGSKEFTTDEDSEGRTILLIREVVSNDLQSSNSDIAKARKESRGTSGF